MRFKPARGITTPKPNRAAASARAEVLGEKNADERLFDTRRHESEVRRSENLAAGLPEDATDAPESESLTAGGRDQRFRAPDLSKPAHLEEEDDAQAQAQEKEKAKEKEPKTLFDKARAAVKQVVRKVKQLIKPEPKKSVEVIINTEPLETRVAVLIDSKLEDFTVERTNTERDAILAFLDARAAVESFDWTDPRGNAGKYVCEAWQVTMRAYNFNTIQATFREVFEP
jgi:phage-related protein